MKISYLHRFLKKDINLTQNSPAISLIVASHISQGQNSTHVSVCNVAFLSEQGSQLSLKLCRPHSMATYIMNNKVRS